MTTTNVQLVASMATPSPEESEDAAVLLLYWARNYLDLIARSEPISGPPDEHHRNSNLEHIKASAEGAASYLASAKNLLSRETHGFVNEHPTHARKENAILAVERAHEAARAVVHNVAVFITYNGEGQRDARIAKKTAVDYHSEIVHKSARYANQEVHRALIELANVFPESFRGED